MSTDINDSPSQPPELDPLVARRFLAQLEAQGMASLEPLAPSLVEEIITARLDPDLSLPLKIIHPRLPATMPRPLIVLFYGGGFNGGSIDQLTEPARTYAERFNAVVILGSYRLCPEVKWPVPWKDGWNLLVYLSRHAHEPSFGGAELDSGKGGGFIVGGISAGASIAVVCTEIDALGLEAREGMQKLYMPLTGVMANVPFLLVPEIVPEHWKARWTAWTDNEDVEGFNTHSLKRVVKVLQCTDYTSCWFSPIPELLKGQHTLDKHPRVYVSVCQRDPLRDDGMVYCGILKERGATVRCDMFPEDGHGGWTIVRAPSASKDPTIQEGNLDGMKWLLRR